MKSITFIILLGLVFTQTITAQQKDTKELKQLFSKVQSIYDQKKEFQIDTKYHLYKTYVDKTPQQSYKGKIARQGDVYYSDVLNTEILQRPNSTLRVSHEQKLIEVSKGEKMGEISPFKLDMFLKFFVDHNITEVNGQIRCEMLANKITTLPYGKVIIFIDKNDFTIKKQILYYLQAVEYRNEDGSIELRSPKLELEFSSFKIKNLLADSAFKESSYVQTSSKVITPVEALQNYNIIDRR